MSDLQPMKFQLGRVKRDRLAEISKQRNIKTFHLFSKEKPSFRFLTRSMNFVRDERWKIKGGGRIEKKKKESKLSEENVYTYIYTS